MNTLVKFAVPLILFIACRPIHKETAELESSSSGNFLDLQLPFEPIPFNSMPISQLNEEAKQVFAGGTPPPVVQVSHSKGGVPHGVRYLQTQRDIAKYIRPGDVFVAFIPMTKDTDDPMMLVQHGMYHAGLVISNKLGGKDLFFPNVDGQPFLCHFDTTAGYDPSGCTFDGPTHFFRINADSPTYAKALNWTSKIFGNWSYDYLFQLNAAETKDVTKLAANISTQTKPSFYCSELPFSVHSLALGKPIFRPTTIGDILDEFNNFRSENRSEYKLDLSDESTTKAIVYYFASFLPERTQTILNNPVTRSYVKGALTTPQGADSKQGIIARTAIVPPWQFMREAKAKNPMVSYVGTYYPGEYKAVAIPVTAMAQLKSLHQLLLRNDKTIKEGAAKLTPAASNAKLPFEHPGRVHKLGRLVQYVRTRPAQAPSDISATESETLRAEATAKIESKIITASAFKNLEYNTYLEICDELNTTSELARVTRKQILKAMVHGNIPSPTRQEFQRASDADDVRMVIAWEDLGCHMAAHFDIEATPPNESIVKEVLD